ncbi:S1 family peptidase [Gordonia araii]|nr:serine protease [Gordonia araii]NNG97913.1 trypsin-like peptidase domain-containing protein [Gordonia araii NBRC 100433]
MTGAGPVTADPVAVNERVSKALVFLLVQFTGQVQIPFTDGAAWSEDVSAGALCTGYIVDPTGFVATAGHCVNVSDDSLKNEIREQAVIALAKKQNRDATWASNIYRRAVSEAWPVRGAGGDGEKPTVSVKAKQASGPNQVIREWTTLQVVASQAFRDGDNAILKINSAPGQLTALPIAKDVPKTGESITSVGFPSQVRKVSDDITLPQPSFKTGTVSSRQQNPSGVAQTEVSATLGKGMSGGPTVNAAGEVIGTNSMKTVSSDETSEFGFITDNVALRLYLQNNGVALAAPEEEGSGLNMWIWLGPLIGLLALILIVGLVLGLRRKPKSGPPNFGGGGGPGGGGSPFGGPTAPQGIGQFGAPTPPAQPSGFPPPSPQPGFGTPPPQSGPSFGQPGFPPPGQQPGYPGSQFGR